MLSPTITQPEHHASSPHAHFAISPEPEHQDQDTKDIVALASPIRRAALKERTQSMEMADIIEALHQEDEVQKAWEERDQTVRALHRSNSIVSMSGEDGTLY
jgi:hypothetical protein